MFDEVNQATAQLVAAGDKLGGDAAAAAKLFKQAVDGMVGFVDASATQPKPADLSVLAAPLVAATEALSELGDKRGPFDQHARLLSDAAGVVFWVGEAKPGPFVDETLATVQFTANKLMTAAKGKPDAELHVAFAKAPAPVFAALKAVVKANFPTGLVWNRAGSGGTAATAAGAAAAAAPSAAAEPFGEVKPLLETLGDLSAAVDADVTASFALTSAAFAIHGEIVALAATSSRPADFAAAYLERLGAAISAVEAAAEAKRRAKSFLYLEALQLLSALLAWVSLTEKPLVAIKENADVLNFTLDKIMRDGGKAWALAVRAIVASLTAFVTANHKTGLYFAGGAAGANKAAPAKHTDAAAGGAEAALAAAFGPLPALAAAVDPALGKACESLAALAAAQQAFLTAARAAPKPADPSAALGDMPALLGATAELAEQGAQTKNLANHFQAVGEAASLFNWVVVEKPLPFLEENSGTVDFFANRAMADNKGNAACLEWGKALRGAVAALQAMVKSDFRLGVVYGGPAAAAATAAPLPGAPAKGVPPPKPPGGRAGPPPPPPPPPAAKAPAAPPVAAAAAGAGDMSALFAQISAQGLDITKRLRHVTDEQKVYKQANREVRTVDEAEIARKKKKSAHSYEPPTGAPLCELQADKKWVVEYQRGDSAEAAEASEDGMARVTIAEPDKRHAVLIRRCFRAYIKISAKVNSITLLECARVQLELDSTVGPIEVTSSEEVEILIHGNVPNVICGKVKGLVVHLAGDDPTQTEFVTSCATSVNITYGIVDADGDRDRVEVAVPEQFATKIGKRNKLVTNAVEHSGA